MRRAASKPAGRDVGQLRIAPRAAGPVTMDAAKVVRTNSEASTALIAAEGCARRPKRRHATASSQSHRSAVLSQKKLDAIVATATARWAATGLTEQQLTRVAPFEFEVADLPSIYLGEADGNRIRVSSNAGATAGMFRRDVLPRVLGSPRRVPSERESVFAKETSATRSYTDPASDAAGRIDLLTTILHEMGHAIGLPDSYDEKDRGHV